MYNLPLDEKEGKLTRTKVDYMNENVLRHNNMQNDDEVLNGHSQEGGLPDGSFARWAPPILLQGIGTYKPIVSTDDTVENTANNYMQ